VYFELKGCIFGDGKMSIFILSILVLCIWAVSGFSMLKSGSLPKLTPPTDIGSALGNAISGGGGIGAPSGALLTGYSSASPLGSTTPGMGALVGEAGMSATSDTLIGSANQGGGLESVIDSNTLQLRLPKRTGDLVIWTNDNGMSFLCLWEKVVLTMADMKGEEFVGRMHLTQCKPYNFNSPGSTLVNIQRPPAGLLSGK
jgi:hypothetical protein